MTTANGSAANGVPPNGVTASGVPAPGLRYSADAEPGLRRVGRGKGFGYLDLVGRPVRDEQTLQRIRALVIPPAWTDVWICRDARGHLQATGRDARGRKQYRYHERYRASRETDKYGRLVMVGSRLPRVRRRVARDLARPGLPRDRVLALVVRLLELSHMRVGNDEYAAANRSFGLTTLRDRHARIAGSTVGLRFTGKSEAIHELRIRDRRLARLVSRCQDLPGQRLFGYLDADGARHDIHSDDVNEYLRRISGADMTAKDLRTWAGTVLAWRELRRVSSAEGPTRERRDLAQAIDAVAARLGNTRAVARASYVHPAVVDAWRAGELSRSGAVRGPQLPPMPAEEREVLRLLRAAQRRERTTAPGARRKGAARATSG